MSSLTPTLLPVKSAKAYDKNVGFVGCPFTHMKPDWGMVQVVFGIGTAYWVRRMFIEVCQVTKIKPEVITMLNRAHVFQ
jgi:hypothetical protein